MTDEQLSTDPAVRQRAFRDALAAYVGLLWRQRRISLPALAFPALGNVFVFYLPPLVIAGLLDRVTAGEVISDGDVRRAVAAFVGLWLVGEVWWRIGIHLLNRTDAYGIETLYTEGMRDLLARDLRFFHDNFGGSLTKRVVSYATKYEPFVDTFAFNIVGNLLPLTVSTVVLWRYDARLVLAMLGMLGLTAMLVVPLIRRRQALVDAREAASAAVAGHVADTLTNMDAVRAHAAELRELTVHRANVSEHRRLALRSWDYHNLRIDGAAAPMAAITNGVGLLLALSLRDGPVGGGIQVEAVYLTLAYYLQSTRIIFDFNSIYRNLESAITEAAQFTELLQAEPTVIDPPAPQPLAPRDSSVHFDRVVFRYPGTERPLFDGLDLRIESGERVGLVGRSGGGKTTLTRLLLRLMDVEAGAVRIGGQDIRDCRQDDLRSLLASVPQDPVMFHRSIQDNIAFGRPGATDDQIRAAAEAAHATEFVLDLPQGFDTLVGERGVKLSGGQRQRVAIARAILRDAPILVLDEATSALDSESEALIQDALGRLLTDRTAVVVAHRLSTVASMDRLVVVDDGRVVESGSHEELLRVGGVYAGLWAHQSGGFLVEDDETSPVA